MFSCTDSEPSNFLADITQQMKTTSVSQLCSGGMSWNQMKEIAWCRISWTALGMPLTLSRFVLDQPQLLTLTSPVWLPSAEKIHRLSLSHVHTFLWSRYSQCSLGKTLKMGRDWLISHYAGWFTCNPTHNPNITAHCTTHKLLFLSSLSSLLSSLFHFYNEIQWCNIAVWWMLNLFKICEIYNLNLSWAIK